MALFTSVLAISTLYAFMVSGTAPVTAASDAALAVFVLMALPFSACSALVARTGAGATAPNTIRASWQIPSLIVITEATLTMG